MCMQVDAVLVLRPRAWPECGQQLHCPYLVMNALSDVLLWVHCEVVVPLSLVQKFASAQFCFDAPRQISVVLRPAMPQTKKLVKKMR